MTTRAKLQVGEAAKLLGITPKTIRYYQKIGLLAEGVRSESGYRLFDAADLIRLQQIKRLQTLGMSLDRIRVVLGEPNLQTEPSLRSVLQILLEETQTEIGLLQARQHRLQNLLDRDTLDLDQPFETPPVMALIKEQLGDYLAGLSPSVLTLEERMQAALADYQWPTDYETVQARIIEVIKTHPERYQFLLAVSEQFAALADLPPDAPQVDEVVAAFRRLPQEFPELVSLGDFTTSASPALNEILTSVLTHSVGPAQRRVLERLKEEMK